MGIDGGAKIKALLRAAAPHAFLVEPRRGAHTDLYKESKHWIVDWMIELYRKPPTVRYWRDFVPWCMETWVAPALSSGVTMVMIFDNSAKTPKNKAECQGERRARVKVTVPVVDIRDDDVIPDWTHFMQTGGMRPRLYVYLLEGLRAAILRMDSSRIAGALYAHCPYSAAAPPDQIFLQGGVVELTETGVPGPPECGHGEGDMLCRTWADFFLTTGMHDRPIIVRSVDLDMLAIFAIKETPVLLHIGNVVAPQGKSKQKTHAEFIDIKALCTALKKRGVRMDDFVFALILSGTDYTKKVPGIGGGRVVNAVISRAAKRAAGQSAFGPLEEDPAHTSRVLQAARIVGMHTE